MALRHEQLYSSTLTVDQAQSDTIQSVLGDHNPLHSYPLMASRGLAASTALPGEVAKALTYNQALEAIDMQGDIHNVDLSSMDTYYTSPIPLDKFGDTIQTPQLNLETLIDHSHNGWQSYHRLHFNHSGKHLGAYNKGPIDEETSTMEQMRKSLMRITFGPRDLIDTPSTTFDQSDFKTTNAHMGEIDLCRDYDRYTSTIAQIVANHTYQNVPTSLLHVSPRHNAAVCLSGKIGGLISDMLISERTHLPEPIHKLRNEMSLSKVDVPEDARHLYGEQFVFPTKMIPMFTSQHLRMYEGSAHIGHTTLDVHLRGVREGKRDVGYLFVAEHPDGSRAFEYSVELQRVPMKMLQRQNKNK